MDSLGIGLLCFCIEVVGQIENIHAQQNKLVSIKLSAYPKLLLEKPEKSLSTIDGDIPRTLSSFQIRT